MNFDPIDMASSAILLLLLTALAAPLFRRNQGLLINTCFMLASVASFLGAAAGIWSVSAAITNQVVLPVGLPDLPFHLRLDALSGFFLTVIGLLSFFVSIYSIGYVKGYLGQRPVTSLVVFY